MAALTCDICGGRLKIGKGKIAICENCGMEHSVERVREKIQEVKGTVHVDNAHLIENFLSMAQDAYSTENYAEAERYCNKVLENDSSHAEASFLKGKAVGWQSTINNFRLKESAICFANAMNFMGDNSGEMLIEISDQFRAFATSLCNLRTERFSKWTDQEESDGFCSDIREMKAAIDYFTRKSNIKLDKNVIFSDFSFSIYTTLGIAVSNKILLEYYSDRSRSAYNTFVEKTKYCVRILEETILLCDDDDASDANLFELIVTMLQRVLDNNSSDYIGNRWGAYTEQPRLSSSEKSDIESKIRKCKTKKL